MVIYVEDNNELTTDFYEVEDGDRDSNDKTLSGLNAVDASVDVDGVGTEDGQHPHVDVVEHTCRNTATKHT